MCQKISKAAIVGRAKNTVNYEKALAAAGAAFLSTMDLGRLAECDALILPGGGDITPAFFGQKNQGSKKIDIELDIIQLQALELFVKWKRPVLGICKGIQIINVYFGGTIIQDLPQAKHHAWNETDMIHSADAVSGSFLATIYGSHFLVNSAHHQGIGNLGRELNVVQTADDGIIEGICHDTLPILGVQWHPERLIQYPSANNTVDGRLLFSYFLSLCKGSEA